jgi:hypothetical protein
VVAARSGSRRISVLRIHFDRSLSLVRRGVVSSCVEVYSGDDEGRRLAAIALVSAV